MSNLVKKMTDGEFKRKREKWPAPNCVRKTSRISAWSRVTSEELGLRLRLCADLENLWILFSPRFVASIHIVLLQSYTWKHPADPCTSILGIFDGRSCQANDLPSSKVVNRACLSSAVVLSNSSKNTTLRLSCSFGKKLFKGDLLSQPE